MEFQFNFSNFLNRSNFAFKGLEDSVSKGTLLEENDYEAEGSTKMPKSNGPFKGRMNASCQVSYSFSCIAT